MRASRELPQTSEVKGDVFRVHVHLLLSVCIRDPSQTVVNPPAFTDPLYSLLVLLLVATDAAPLWPLVLASHVCASRSAVLLDMSLDMHGATVQCVSRPGGAEAPAGSCARLNIPRHALCCAVLW